MSFEGQLIKRQYAEQACDSSYRQETIKEGLQRQINYHEEKVAALKAAMEAISPEVERALDALRSVNF